MNIFRCAALFLACYGQLCFAMKPLFQKQMGMAAEYVHVPEIAPGSEVLDVGAGDGVLTQKMIEKIGKSVCALEPGSENDVETLRKNLPKGSCIIAKTLQDAVNDPQFTPFDVVTVFKYNVPLSEKESFIEALHKSVKRSGKIYITSVEEERFHLTKDYSGMYLNDELAKYFDFQQPEIIQNNHGAYEILQLTPKQSLYERKSNDESQSACSVQ